MSETELYTICATILRAFNPERDQTSCIKEASSLLQLAVIEMRERKAERDAKYKVREEEARKEAAARGAVTYFVKP